MRNKHLAKHFKSPTLNISTPYAYDQNDKFMWAMIKATNWQNEQVYSIVVLQHKSLDGKELATPTMRHDLTTICSDATELQKYINWLDSKGAKLI